MPADFAPPLAECRYLVLLSDAAGHYATLFLAPSREYARATWDKAVGIAQLVGDSPDAAVAWLAKGRGLGPGPHAVSVHPVNVMAPLEDE